MKDEANKTRTKVKRGTGRKTPAAAKAISRTSTPAKTAARNGKPEAPKDLPKVVTEESSLPEYFYDGKSYFGLTSDGNFIPLSSKDVKLALKRRLVEVNAFSQSYYRMNLHEYALSEAQERRFVDYANSLAGHRPGLFETADGRRILVTRGPRIIPAMKGPMPHLEKFFAELLSSKQLHWFLAWLKFSRQDLQAPHWRNWHAAQMVVLAGPPSCGKSFAQHLITEWLGGRAAKPYRYMAEKTEFNGDLAEAEHLMIEDENASKDTRSRRTFGTRIKEFTVNAEISVHPKNKQAITLPTYRRLTLSVNEEPENLAILPPMDASIRDRVSLFKCGKAELSEDRAVNWKNLAGELPALAYHLENEFEVPESMLDPRFQVKAFHNPELLEALNELEPQNRLLELIDQILFGKDSDLKFWKSTSAELEKRLCESSLAVEVHRVLYWATACGSFLGRLALDLPHRVKKTKSGNTVSWTIFPPARSE